MIYLTLAFIGCEFQYSHRLIEPIWEDISGKLCGWSTNEKYIYLYFYVKETGKINCQELDSDSFPYYRVNPSYMDRIEKALSVPTPKLEEIPRFNLMDFEK